MILDGKMCRSGFRHNLGWSKRLSIQYSIFYRYMEGGTDMLSPTSASAGTKDLSTQT